MEKFYLNVQMWDRDLFASNDFIADKTFPWSKEALDAYRNEEVVEIKLKEKVGLLVEKSPKDRFWLSTDCFNAKSHEMEQKGQIQLSIKLFPQEKADACQNGDGRDSPNIDPWLPPPVGRLVFTLNPCKMFNQLVGPAFRRKICCVICCILCLIIIGFSIPAATGSLGSPATWVTVCKCW